MRSRRTSGVPESTGSKSSRGTVSVAASRGSGPAIAAVSSAAVLDRARKRPERIERRRQRYDAGKADRAVGRLQAGRSAQRRRDAYRSAGVGADRRGCQARGDRHGGSARSIRRRRGACAHPKGSRESPIGSLRPQPPKANSTMCVLPSGIMPAASRLWTAVAVSVDSAAPALRARRRHPVLDVQQILERDRQAVQRAAEQPRLAFEIGRGGAIERGFSR